jgi:DNA-binding PadR family transcriptional regulator
MKKDSLADVWDSLVKNRDLVRGAEIAQSFPILLVLNGAEKPLTTSEVSQRIAGQSKGAVFLIPSTARSALEVLRNADLVEGKDEANKGNERKPIARTLYSISPKGKKLVKAWVGFLSAID